MKGKLLGLLIAVLLLTIAFSGCFENKKEEGKLSIQQLINKASIGDSIIIPIGTYIENVSINKSIILVGEDKEKTIIEGNVNIFADNVTLSNFTIKNGTGVSIRGYEDGSSVHFYNNTITNNIITGNTNPGVGLKWAFNTKVTNNIIENNGDGIWLEYAGNNNIKDNYITNNSGKGISISFSWENTFYRNTIENNEYGIYLDFFGERNNITQNIIKSNLKYGLYIFNWSNDNNNIYTNNFINNTINAHDECNNIWYNSVLMEGNYWSDYNGTDANGDGIGDTPYNIPGGNNQDRYPLITPYKVIEIEFTHTDFTYTPAEGITTETNVTFNASFGDLMLYGTYFWTGFHWDFGDGTSVVETNMTSGGNMSYGIYNMSLVNSVTKHRYEQPGNYLVELQVIYHRSDGNTTMGHVSKYITVH